MATTPADVNELPPDGYNPTDGCALAYLDIILRLMEEAEVPYDTREKILVLIGRHTQREAAKAAMHEIQQAVIDMQRITERTPEKDDSNDN